MIRAVVFDVGGVLCPSPIDEFARVDAEFGLPAGTVMSYLRGGADFALCETGRLAVADFCRRCVADIVGRHGVEIPVGRLDAMLEAVMGENVRPEMLGLVAEVKAAGYLTGLLTNIFAERRAWLHGLFPPGTIDAFCDSSEVGVRKPDQGIYDQLVGMLGCEPHEIAFVDDFPENLVPARRMGMAGLVFESPDQVRRALVAAGVRILPVCREVACGPRAAGGPASS
jgi:epoxide hydrolase-like predicted phosphatase